MHFETIQLAHTPSDNASSALIGGSFSGKNVKHDMTRSVRGTEEVHFNNKVLLKPVDF